VSRSDYDVVVCGGGVGGLTLAAALGRLSLRVLVLEKHPRPVEVYKGELLQPRSLEILAELGALDALRRTDGVRAHVLECRTADGELIGGLDYRPLGGSFNHVLLHDYRAILAAVGAAAGPSVEIREGARVEELLRDRAGRVAGVRVRSRRQTEEVAAGLIVGADGRLSVVRRLAGIKAVTAPYPHRLVAFDVEGAPPLGPRVTAYLTPTGLRALYPLPNGRARLYVQVASGAFGPIRRAGVERWLAGVVRSTPALRPLEERLLASAARVQLLSAWRGSARALAAPGVALIGDAAHSVHPMAGQGMNSAIADAWLLHEAIRESIAGGGGADGDGDGFPGVADRAAREYEARRLPEVEYVLRLSHHVALLFTATAPLQRGLARWMLRRNGMNRRLQFILTYNMSGFGVRRFTRRDRLYQLGLLRDPNARLQVL